MSLKRYLWLLPPGLLLLNHNCYTLAWIQGRSMEPTLNPTSKSSLTHPSRKPQQDWVIINRLVALNPAKGLKRGDVVFITSPLEPKDLLVKRIVGLPGDWVRKTIPSISEWTEPPFEVDLLHKMELPLDSWIIVPQGHIWVESDSRIEGNQDSLKFGPVPMGLVYGKVTSIVYPFHRYGQSLGSRSRAELEGRMRPMSEDPFAHSISKMV
jgi:inner membrane protease subunit 2